MMPRTPVHPSAHTTRNNEPPRVAVVTGGARVIGRAIGESFLQRGHAVVLIDRDRETLDRTVAALGVPDRLLGLHADVSVPAQVAQAAADVLARLGRVAALVNNAGVAVFKPTLDTAFAEWREVMAANLDGAVLCSDEAGYVNGQVIAVDGGFDAAGIGLPTLRRPVT